MHKEVPKLKTVMVPAADIKKIEQVCAIFTQIWKPTIEAIAPLINQVAGFVPPRRERLQHIGLFGYSRGVGKVKLPRAIGFTASLYSVGVPPELITTGRGLLLAEKKGLLPVIEKYYPALRDDLTHAGKYLNRENLHALAKNGKAWEAIEIDMNLIEKILGITLGPVKPHHILHRNITSNIYQRLKAGKEGELITHDIVEAGVIRRSLG
jgi:phosphoenolpyruvate carboxylase